MSIRFPDLQVLLPRADATSQIAQRNQRQADVSQAQIAAQTAVAMQTERRQISGAQQLSKARIKEREGGRRQSLTQKGSKEGSDRQKQQSQDREGPLQSELGQSVDIRI